MLSIKLDPISMFLANRAGIKGLVTLMYHAVHPDSRTPNWPWAVSYQAFCEQMDLLCELGWNTICASNLESTTSYPHRTVLITFDDGYADNFAAFEALVERKMRATWFIVSRDVGSKSSWPGEIVPPQPMLSAKQLNEMAAAGMEIGSHTVSHCKLTLADDATVASELSDSQKQLSDMLGRSIHTFAYPYGLHDTRIVDAARQASYRIALNTEAGFGLVENDLMRVRRITVFNTDSLSTFVRKLALGNNDVSWYKIRRNAIDHATDWVKSLFH